VRAAYLAKEHLEPSEQSDVLAHVNRYCPDPDITDYATSVSARASHGAITTAWSYDSGSRCRLEELRRAHGSDDAEVTAQWRALLSLDRSLELLAKTAEQAHPDWDQSS
jgi:hypothetical protein